jgi:hypothetical protein
MAFTKLYLTSEAAPITVTNKGSWDGTNTPPTGERKLSPTKTAGGFVTQFDYTENSASTFRGMVYRGVSDALMAQTITGNIDVAIRSWEGSSSADMAWRVHLWVTVGDTDVSRGTLINQYEETTGEEWTTTETVRELDSPQAMTPLAIQNGDRLVVEFGWIAYNSSTSNFSGAMNAGTLKVSDSSILPDAIVGQTSIDQASFIDFSASILELDDNIECAAVFGARTTVKASRAIAFGLDNNINEHNEEGKFKVFGDASVTGHFEVIESSAPAANLNAARIYAVDNGSGKTKLMVQFGTGSPVQIAIEP